MAKWKVPCDERKDFPQVHGCHRTRTAQIQCDRREPANYAFASCLMGLNKNDCDRNAGKRLIASIVAKYPKRGFIVVVEETIPSVVITEKPRMWNRSRVGVPHSYPRSLVGNSSTAKDEESQPTLSERAHRQRLWRCGQPLHSGHTERTPLRIPGPRRRYPLTVISSSKRQRNAPGHSVQTYA